jgi:hypothetical protein
MMGKIVNSAFPVAATRRTEGKGDAAAGAMTSGYSIRVASLRSESSLRLKGRGKGSLLRVV